MVPQNFPPTGTQPCAARAHAPGSAGGRPAVPAVPRLRLPVPRRAHVGAVHWPGDTRAASARASGARGAPSVPLQPRAGGRGPRRPVPGPGQGAPRTAPFSRGQPGAPYLRDNAKAGRLRRTNLTHRAAMTTTRAGTAHVPGMRRGCWPASSGPGNSRRFCACYFLSANRRSYFF